ncbi:CoA pyrophosphatase [Marinobacterium sediminicola]|uniref:8-oxo-dGTP pyrophosphatase MutT, NUDIX family n=1 Tax=Marinobacterium sediminicola TaxID=518898 RepID=A0ABY1S0W7_9GAMM|nr:CoA pyrophosphatase [Marinobacterium sediminicola]ULG69589.1 CoA pyrophosphatase [Marinobacterium sediminicola]SMR74683.1 8-oxo-dGTP pyrophosphatase MutT, NUDIX family [Marinobacterium sediminicola]
MLDHLRFRLQHHRPWRLRTRGREAGVLVALTNCTDPEVILTLRSPHLSTHSGEISFPGGKRDPDDPDLLATAMREAEEEIALSPGNVEVIGSLGQVVSKHHLQVTPWVGVISPSLPLVANPEEIAEIYRVPLSFLLDPANRRMDRLELAGQARFVPAWPWQGEVIWGLTAYILSELLNVGFDADIPMRPRPEHLESPRD